MGFSVRVAKGVRIRVSSRGVRTSVGTRAARVHFGGGSRTRVSSGFGPLTYYTTLGSSSARRTRPASTPSRATTTTSVSTTPTPAQQRKHEEAVALRAAFEAIRTLPQAEFPPLERQLAEPPPAVATAEVRSRHRREARAATSFFRRDDRRRALAEADRRADMEIRELTGQNESRWHAHQQALDAGWEALGRNDPDVVLGALAGAFEDNEAAAAPVGVDRDQVTVLVAVPPLDAVPERIPGTTAAGNLTLKKLTKRDRASFYSLLVAGHVLYTVKEAFAVGRGLGAVRVVAVRQAPPDAYGQRAVEVILAGLFERERLEGVRWSEAPATQIVQDTNTELLWVRKGAAQELAAIDLTREPELAALLSAVEIDDLW